MPDTSLIDTLYLSAERVPTGRRDWHVEPAAADGAKPGFVQIFIA